MSRGGTVSAAGSHTLTRYARKAMTRAAMRALIRGLVRWTPLHNPGEGYTLVVGCNSRLAGMIPANLRGLARQHAPNCGALLLVMDCAASEMPADFEDRMAREAGALPLRVVWYTDRQRSVSRAIDWGWIYSWLSWSIGIGEARTRYVMLHDFDAVLLKPTILEERYRAIRREKAEYLGVGYYQGLGVIAEDALLKTFELMFDAAFVRRTFEPIDLFNKMAVHRGRRVEFDTFLYAQSKAGRGAVVPIDETEMVHPSQMICQFVDFSTAKRRVPDDNNLLMIPYYASLSGDTSMMDGVTADLGAGPAARLWGRTLDVSRVSPVHAAWLRKQGLRLEQALEPAVRPNVAAYFDAIDARAKGGGA